MPRDLVCRQTAYGYFSGWSKDGTWEWVQSYFVQKLRRKSKRKASPSAGRWIRKVSARLLVGVIIVVIMPVSR